MSLEIGRALEAQRRPDEYQHALEIVDAETARMTRLVNDLMTLARMDSGQAILQLADVDLSDVALEAVERMMPLAERSEVALETGELPELKIRGDHQYLLQMISNLIENGIKYSGKGKRVCVETSAAGGQAALRVSDTGPGIPAEHLPPLFDRFYRADVARTHGADNGDTPSGSGLGLSIVAWIVEAHHGSIHVASRVDEGTTFEVLLPLLAGAHVST
jgi:signal transduction histidine kinase